MTKEQLTILSNVIAGVESGGQVYGKKRYDAYAGAYKNSVKEVTCTLGYLQWYGQQAQELVLRIQIADPEGFKKLDTADIEDQLIGDWVTRKWNPTEKQKSALINIINSDLGRKIQDEMCQEKLQRYIRYAEDCYVKDVRAQMMWSEIEHLGGLSAVRRIFEKISEPYTVDKILDTLKLDQSDSSSNNQVGDQIYWSRHEKCAEWIRKYVPEESEKKTMGVTANKIISIMQGWVGLDRATGTHAPIINAYNGHSPLARGYKVKMTDEYCDTTVSAAFILAGDTSIIGGTECGVEEHVKLFKAAGIWEEDGTIIPAPGYIIVYNWDQNYQPNNGYSDHIGIVEKVSGNQITVIEGNMNGKVGRRTISAGWGYIRGYAKPKYSAEATTSPVVESTAELPDPAGIVIAKEQMNLRKTPANDGVLVSSVPAGTTLNYFFDANASWLAVEYNGQKVYTSDVDSKGTKGVHWYKFKCPDSAKSFLAMCTAYPMKKGTSGTHVKIMQVLLNHIDGANLNVDGDFGNLTHAAIVSYQKMNGITQTGVVDYTTCMSILHKM